jgi:hypothetical protein
MDDVATEMWNGDMSLGRLTVTYTALAGLTPPRKGAIIRFDGTDRDFRVVDVKDEGDGAFTIDIEPAGLADVRFVAAIVEP